MKLLTACASKNANAARLGTAGVVLLAVALLVTVTDPVQKIVDSQLTLRAGSLLYNLWLKPPLEVFIKVYMFNVTNLERFTSGLDAKLKLAEVGPYVYQEILENHNVTFNANNTVTYSPKRTVTFIRERSVGDPNVDRVVAPNIPYMGVTSAASSFSGFAAMAVSALTNKLNSKAMLNVSVHEYLWGYEDRLVHLASKFIPSVINFQRFGLMERMFDEGDNIVTMRLPPKKLKGSMEAKRTPTESDSAKDYSIDTWNGRKDIKFWTNNDNDVNGTVCNSIRGTFDATLFPRNITKGETFRIYRKAFCRTLPIVYSHRSYFNGIEGYNFKLQEDAFDSDLGDPQSSCFCKGNKCLKKGLGNITPCYYNIPLAISFPHFYQADPSLLEPIEGLDPNETKHGSDIMIQPQLGIPMRVHSRFQVNLLMGDIKYNKGMARFRNTVLPILWLEIGLENLSPDLIMLLNVLFKICPYAQMGVVLSFTLIGFSLICTALLLGLWMPTAWNSLSAGKHSIDVSKKTYASLLPQLRRVPVSEKQKAKLSKWGRDQREYELMLLPTPEIQKKNCLV